MKKSAIAAVGIFCAAAVFAPQANADPSVGHGTTVFTQSPNMLCQIGSDDADDPGYGPSVVCQSGGRLGFPQSPISDASGGQPAMHLHQAVVTAAGSLSYRDANIPMGGDLDENGDPTFDTLSNDRTHHIQGWTAVPTTDGITFTNDATSHGMTMDAAGDVKAF